MEQSKKILASLFLWSVAVAGAMAQNGEKYLYEALPDGWAEAEGDDGLFGLQQPVDDEWWRLFGDTTLNRLIDCAVERSYSLLQAMENMQAARISWRTVQGDYFPKIDLSLGWDRQKSSGNLSALPQSWSGGYSAGLSMSWQIDLFGQIRQRAKAQRLGYQASREEYRGVMVTLCAQVATAYFGLRQAQQELLVLQQNAASQHNIVELTQVRYNTGLASKLDVAQARSVYYSTLATIPGTEGSIIQYKNNLCVLLGFYPDALSPWLDSVAPLPSYVEPVGVGIPAQLLLRRPDLRQGVRTVQSKAALLGASKSDWLPTLLLNGSFGYAAEKPGKLLRSKSSTWEIAPTLSVNIFNGFKSYNATSLAKVDLENAVTQFNSTLLSAVQEVENSLALYRNGIRQMAATREAAYQAEETLELSLDLYKQGLGTFQNVLDAQRTLLQYQEGLAQAQGYTLTSLVQLYEALGGGWQQ